MRRFLKWAGIIAVAGIGGYIIRQFGVSQSTIITVIGGFCILYLNNRLEELESEIESIRRDLNL